MQPVRGEAPGACVRCHGSYEEVCGTASPFVWHHGVGLKWAKEEAVRRHNLGPRKYNPPLDSELPGGGDGMPVAMLAVAAGLAQQLGGTQEDDDVVHAYVQSRKKRKAKI